jgi:hypothetical protein
MIERTLRYIGLCQLYEPPPSLISGSSKDFMMDHMTRLGTLVHPITRLSSRHGGGGCVREGCGAIGDTHQPYSIRR